MGFSGESASPPAAVPLMAGMTPSEANCLLAVAAAGSAVMQSQGAHPADISRHSHDIVGATWRCGGQRAGCAGETVLAKIGDADPEPHAGEAHGGGQADTRRTPGDDGDGIGGES
jgi:hypothetical protein